ncbi:acidic mammalian chitinase-like [Neocloeon triangulifer]|uniref:acidic mammalian chitinase-like n=1 Tax=Neocloeon triangulifer TaxID=2078957 RepID=UPI00286F5C41|nr:acidic mammalian chitinase-like [Neocloeon triangulifer]XP_059487164.1 acidic mammalian chitinase-like [Neocloeon triangulifer]
MKCSFVSGILLLTIAVVLTIDQVQSQRVLVCYYSSWAYYRPSKGQFGVDKIDPNLCTHVVYAFVGANSDATVRVMDPWLELEENWGLGLFRQFNELKLKNPSLKTLVAIGGWNEGSEIFSNLVGDSSMRASFVNNLYNFVKNYGFDGLDLDWEYPAQRGGRPEDKQNFVYWIRELRSKFAPEGLLLTAAVHAAISSVGTSYDIQELANNLDYINMMSYDYHGSWEQITGINSPLYPSFVDTDYTLNINASIQYWLNNGCPSTKLLLGIPTFGRTYTLSNPNSPGLGAQAYGPGLPGPYSQESGFLGYNEICELQWPGLWSINWAAQQKVPFAFKGSLWVGYENMDSVKIKADYVKQYNLGGALVWGLETDDFDNVCREGKNPLITTIKNNIN